MRTEKRFTSKCKSESMMVSFLFVLPFSPGSSKYGLQNEDEDDIFGVDSMSNYNIEVSSKRGPQGNLGMGGSQDNRKSLQRCSDGKLPPAGFMVGTHQTPMDKWYAVFVFCLLCFLFVCLAGDLRHQLLFFQGSHLRRSQRILYPPPFFQRHPPCKSRPSCLGPQGIT